MMREYQVRICEGLGVKFPGPTRHFKRSGRLRLIWSVVEMKPMNPSQAARLAPSLQVALTFIGAHIPEDVRATNADAIERAHKSLEAPADADGQIAALLWSIDFIMTHHEGAGPPELGEAFMLLDELKLVTREQLTGGTA
jgi:hypothetical protein